MTEQKEETKNLMEEDMFADSFVYYKIISVQNKKDPKLKTEYKFGLKELTGFEEDKISKRAISIDGRTKKIELNQAEANILLLKAVIVEAPFPISEENIRKLSKKVRDELLDFATEINKVTEDTEKK